MLSNTSRWHGVRSPRSKGVKRSAIAAPRILSRTHRRSRSEEAQHRFGEALRLLQVGDVGSVRDLDEFRAGDECCHVTHLLRMRSVQGADEEKGGTADLRKSALVVEPLQR